MTRAGVVDNVIPITRRAAVRHGVFSQSGVIFAALSRLHHSPRGFDRRKGEL